MSTKATIAYGDNFHLYHEVADDNHVYLELEATEFEASHGRVMISIPISIWETIRPLGGARLELVNHMDEDLLAMVEADVDERIACHEKLLRENPDRAGLASLCGLLVYGGADDPREEQIKSGMEHYRHERERQRTVLAAIKELREAQHSEGPAQPRRTKSRGGSADPAARPFLTRVFRHKLVARSGLTIVGSRDGNERPAQAGRRTGSLPL